ncbi:FGGY-family carbohydrate kinase [Oharaeibacter diazotrophicus]|uniref:L-ribulokinase n=1 Tax=Oharaeibacter diazotrophicus TaxID=1920512 RepID=A0A4R6R6K3_9HYPH|nr:FGGY-family carbohydrate kinase [Oharaeibacter diazotrophicus]TDP81167.1 L-ribulokinase [Oharaeibacter diazotrophicus]BBE74839.1 ribulokinase [Pleomorphomonas sp. SM30]GLS75657.1 ribulokinase [Oharaeibacter diazotrophicus]
MAPTFLIGLDFGTESARGVLVDVATGRQEAYHVHRYRHGVVTGRLGGTALPPGFALQVPADYLEAAEAILAAIGRGREVAAIGLDFTASSPMPALADGTALADLMPEEPHAQVKLWKHSAQAEADRLGAAGGDFLADFGGKVSGEWLLAKAAEIATAAPEVWARTERFLEAGDWLVRRLSGREARSLDFAAYKAQWREGAGYPAVDVPGLSERLAPPLPVGSPAGRLTDDWAARTGILGSPVVAVAVIDSHVVLPAIGAVGAGGFVGALGTSAAFLLLGAERRPLPAGLEGAAFGAVLPGIWCAEAGQAAFGDMLGWFVRTFPRGGSVAESFAAYDAEAAALPPGAGGLVALDWFGGNRIPLADANLSGLILGLGLATSAAEIYRALVESLCLGTRSILELAEAAGVPVTRVVMTSGLARRSPFLLDTLADVLNRPVEVPDVDNPTALGAALHGAVAAGVVPDFPAAAARWGARTASVHAPDRERASTYDALFAEYRRLAGDPEIRAAMHALKALGRRR